MKKFAIFCLCFLILATACQRDSSWQRVQATGILKVGLDPTYPPFELADGQPLAGLDVDLAEALAADLGVRAEFVYFGYDGLYDALLTEQVDVLISALVIAPERMEDFAYSEPYFNAGEILIVQQGESDVTEMADLHGRILAVELGAQGHVEALQWAQQLPDLTVQPFNSADEALTAVISDTADATLIDSISGRLFLHQNPEAGLTWLPDPVTVEPYAIVVRRDDQSLLEQLDASLKRLQASGELATITEKWLGP
ncbi:MAG: amino acid ABC transporter substrate-binding protein [Anaerolineales bacterium]|nr:amino acid ABC transporter substrate-binding protein [Anaerolineales bacterium]